MMIPFGIMLLVIAVAPLIVKHIWEKNLNKLIFVLALSIPAAAYMAYIGLGDKVVDQIFFDYLPFIILLCTLFVVTGGIKIQYNMTATPLINAIVLLIGFNISSFIGTTGAAMLLIRPLLEINKCRRYKAHTICFFIALVANCGGVLSPLGDPPLFLLYLRGAPFEWFTHLFPEWAFVGALLLAIYFVTDKILYRKETEGKVPTVCNDEDEDDEDDDDEEHDCVNCDRDECVVRLECPACGEEIFVESCELEDCEQLECPSCGEMLDVVCEEADDEDGEDEDGED